MRKVGIAILTLKVRRVVLLHALLLIENRSNCGRTRCSYLAEVDMILIAETFASRTLIHGSRYGQINYVFNHFPSIKRESSSQSCWYVCQVGEQQNCPRP